MCRITWEIEGLTEGKHGFIFTKRPTLATVAKAQDRTNPFESHGEERHAGDLGNIFADENGTLRQLTSRIMRSKATPVVGRSVMVHADEDDLGRGDNSNQVQMAKQATTPELALPVVSCWNIPRVVFELKQRLSLQNFASIEGERRRMRERAEGYGYALGVVQAEHQLRHWRLSPLIITGSQKPKPVAKWKKGTRKKGRLVVWNRPKSPRRVTMGTSFPLHLSASPSLFNLSLDTWRRHPEARSVSP